MADSSNDFALLLARFRRAAGLSQRALAARAGMSARGISNLERGVRRLPYPHTVAALADALALSGAERDAFFAAARPERTQPTARPDVSPLFGRAAEVEAIEKHLDVSGPGLLLLAGEPGIGKTRLLQEAATQVQRRGMLLLAGGCDRHGGEEPYAPFPALLAGLLEGQPVAARTQFLAGCEWLVRLVPDLAAPDFMPPPLDLPPAQVRRLIFSAVRRLLARASGGRPTILLLDDLQWAGAGALDLLEFLLVRGEPGSAAPSGPAGAGSAGLRAIGAYRDTELAANHPLRPMLAALAERGLARQIDLRLLDSRAAAELVNAFLPDGGEDAAVRQRIVERAGGIPFVLISSARSAGTGEDGVPWSVAQSVRRRVAALAPATGEVLAAAAILGRGCTAALLAAMTGMTDDQVLSAIDDACRGRILVPDTPPRYQFEHDIVREVVEDDLGPDRLVPLHRRAGEVLQSAGAEPAAIGRHFVAAREPARAWPWLLDAGGRAAEALDHEGAERLYREALACAVETGDSAGEAAALEKLGLLLNHHARYEEALALLERAAAIYRDAGDPEGEGRVVGSIGMTYLYQGSEPARIRRAEELLPRLEAQGPSAAHAGLLLALSSVHFGVSRYTESALTAERAAEAATAIGDDRLLARARAQLGACLNSTHRNEAAIEVLEDAVALAERSGDLRAIYAATNNLGISYHLAGRLRDSLACQERVMALSERLGDPAWIAMSLRNAGQTLFELGEWPRARTLLERAVEVARESPSWCTPYALSSLGLLCAGEGRAEEGRLLAEEALAQANASGDIAPICVALHALTVIDLDGDMVAQALERLAPHVEGSGPKHVIVFALLFPVAAEAQVRLGNLGRASELVDAALGHVSPTDGPDVLADLLRLRALIAARSERQAEAREACERALALARRCECARMEAEILAADARILAGEGRGEQARARLDEALAIFRRLGATPAARRVERALAAASRAG